MNEDTLLPLHVFVPMLWQQSARSPEGKYDSELITEPGKHAW